MRSDERDPRDPLTQLERCHRRTEERLDELVQASAEEEGSEQALEVVQGVLGFFARAIQRHEADEEQSLFPRLAKNEKNETVTSCIERLRTEHVTHQELHARLESAVARWREGGARELPAIADALVAAYRTHIEEEERVLFPAARASLSPEDLAAMAQEMEARREGGAAGRERGRERPPKR
jgi:hemerythrin-like domain-containing protein